MLRKGILLFEVMVSMAVISSVVLFVMRAYSGSKRSLDDSTEAIKIGLLLEDKIWELEQAESIEEASQSGDLAGGYAWKIDSRRSEDPKLDLVTVEVFRKQGSQREKHSILTYAQNNNE